MSAFHAVGRDLIDHQGEVIISGPPEYILTFAALLGDFPELADDLCARILTLVQEHGEGAVFEPGPKLRRHCGVQE